MPELTFFKFTREKQKDLIDAAIYKFSTHSFNEIKLSQIIYVRNL